MIMHRKKYCVANWKMNLSQSDIKSFIVQWEKKNLNHTNIKTIFCPSFTDINVTADLLQNSLSENL